MIGARRTGRGPNFHSVAIRSEAAPFLVEPVITTEERRHGNKSRVKHEMG